jgi:hypothetical protein
MTTYIEEDCTFTHEGRTFEAGGAVVTPDFAIGYVRDLKAITNWHGDQVLGNITAVKSWRTSRSYVSDRQYQITARISGVLYTGRSGGSGMIWRGKPCKRQ